MKPFTADMIVGKNQNVGDAFKGCSNDSNAITGLIKTFCDKSGILGNS
jgi:hypothetical protein